MTGKISQRPVPPARPRVDHNRLADGLVVQQLLRVRSSFTIGVARCQPLAARPARGLALKTAVNEARTWAVTPPIDGLVSLRSR
jgi:hypothetical protein